MTPRPLSRNQKGFIVKKWNTMSIAEIADALNVEEQKVKEWLQYKGLLETKPVHEARIKATATPDNKSEDLFQHDKYYKSY